MSNPPVQDTDSEPVLYFSQSNTLFNKSLLPSKIYETHQRFRTFKHDIVALENSVKKQQIFVLTSDGSLFVFNNRSEGSKLDSDLIGNPKTMAYDWLLDVLYVVTPNRTHTTISSCTLGEYFHPNTECVLF